MAARDMYKKPNRDEDARSRNARSVPSRKETEEATQPALSDAFLTVIDDRPRWIRPVFGRIRASMEEGSERAFPLPLRSSVGFPRFALLALGCPIKQGRTQRHEALLHMRASEGRAFLNKERGKH